MEPSADPAGASLAIQSIGDRDGIRVRVDDAVQERIEPPDALEVGGRQLDGRQVTSGKALAELGDRGLEPRCAAVRVAPWRVLTVDRPIVAMRVRTGRSRQRGLPDSRTEELWPEPASFRDRFPPGGR